jgi:xyloglucan-specific exo-beta-1,4-glucanase
LFVATDAGVYYTINGGTNWIRAGNNMPVIPVYSLGLNTTGTKLVAGTFARSIQTLSIPALLTGTVAEASLPQFVSFWPNPAQDILTLELPSAADAAIYDLNGKELLRQQFTAGVNTFSVNTLPAGTYLISTNANGVVRTSRFVKL